MQKKADECDRAIRLRRQGYTYGEILEKIPVAKSTLSLWLKSVGLAKPQMQRLTTKRLEAGRRGGLSRRNARLKESEKIMRESRHEVGALSQRELWLIGATLYWAEGSKQHVHNPSVGVIFSNSDPAMHAFFLQWLRYIHIPDNKISIELFVHASRSPEIEQFKQWWIERLHLSRHAIQTVYIKQGNAKTNRHNVADLYHGLLRIKVAESTSLNRRIQGWIAGIADAAR